MEDRDKHQRPSRSSSPLGPTDRKRRDPDPPGKDAKRRKDTTGNQTRTKAISTPAPAAVAGSSGTSTLPPEFSSKDEKLDRLSALLVGLIDKLDKGSASDVVSTDRMPDFSGFHDLPSSDGEDGNLPARTTDPLDELDKLSPAPVEDNVDFLRALEDLSGHFHGEEEKSEPLFERLASALDSSLRRRPSAYSVKQTCNKIKLPSNMPNLAVPVTNSAITKAMSVGGKLIDSSLAH